MSFPARGEGRNDCRGLTGCGFGSWRGGGKDEACGREIAGSRDGERERWTCGV